MPLQFVAQGPMLIPAVGAGVTFISRQGGFADWGLVTTSGFTSSYCTVPPDCTAMVIVVVADLNPPIILTWDFTGSPQLLTEVGFNTGAWRQSVYAVLNPHTGNLGLNNATSTGSTHCMTGVLYFKGVNSSIGSAFTDFTSGGINQQSLNIPSNVNGYVVGGVDANSASSINPVFGPNGFGHTDNGFVDADCGYASATGTSTTITGVPSVSSINTLWGMAVNP